MPYIFLFDPIPSSRGRIKVAYIKILQHTQWICLNEQRCFFWVIAYTRNVYWMIGIFTLSTHGNAEWKNWFKMKKVVHIFANQYKFIRNLMYSCIIWLYCKAKKCKHLSWVSRTSEFMRVDDCESTPNFRTLDGFCFVGLHQRLFLRPSASRFPISFSLNVGSVEADLRLDPAPRPSGVYNGVFFVFVVRPHRWKKIRILQKSARLDAAVRQCGDRDPWGGQSGKKQQTKYRHSVCGRSSMKQVW